MQQLNFPAYTFRFKSSENKILIFDEIRKKFVRLTPEEWVRQHVIQFLIHQKKYPKTLISVEKRITVAQLNKRYDIVVYTPEGDIQLLVECKAPEVTVSQEVLDQTARYKLLLKADYLMVTNGLQHYYCMMDYENQMYIFKKQLPDFQ